MMTLSKTEEKKLRRAGAKAKAEKPLVRRTDRHNVWLVRSSDKSTFYTVTFSKGDKPGEIKADCTCPNASKKNHNCKHPMAAYGLYKQAVIERAKAHQCSEGCDVPAIEGETLCPDCLNQPNFPELPNFDRLKLNRLPQYPPWSSAKSVMTFARRRIC